MTALLMAGGAGGHLAVSDTGPQPVASVALVLLAAAVLLAEVRWGSARLTTLAARPEHREPPRLRTAWVGVAVVAFGGIVWACGGGLVAMAAGAGLPVAAAAALRRAATTGTGQADRAALAAAWELLAVCLHAGMPVAVAAATAAAPLTGDVGMRLRRVAGLLELGAEPGAAWDAAAQHPELAVFARAAARSAGTGAALAQVAHNESKRIRSGLIDAAEARAQRAAVHITGPLGLCFLPSFLVLGIAPVVIGLASEALARW